MGILHLNGSDTQSVLDVSPTDLLDWYSGLVVDIDSVQPHGVHLAMRGSGFRAPARPWPLQARLKKALRADREAGLDALHRQLAAVPSGVDSYRLAQEGEVEIRVSPSTRVAYAVCRGVRGMELPGATPDVGFTNLTLDFLFFDQARYDAAAMTQAIVAGSGLEEEIALGTLPSWWRLEIDGPVTDPELIVYEDASGVPGDELWRMAFTWTGGSGETLVVDALRQIAYEEAAPATDLTDDVLPVGGTNTAFHLLESADLDAVWVELTTGSGTLNWRRRWK